MANLDVQESLAEFVIADVNESVGDTLTKLRNANLDFIVVTKKWDQQDIPVSVLREPALISLATEQDQKLEELLKDFPPMLMLEESELGDDDLPDVLTILGKTNSPGVVVHLPNNFLGIVSRASLARAVRLEDIALAGRERNTVGAIGVPPRSYICNQCVPERRKLIRVGGPPDCDVWSHGPMEEE